MEKTTNNPPDFDIYSLLKPYLAKWYWFLISGVIFILVAILYIKTATPIYSIQGAVLIKDAKKSISGSPMGSVGILDGLSGFGGMSTNSIENEIEIFKSKKLVRDIVSLNSLQTTIYSTEELRKKELFGDTAPIIIHVLTEKKNKKFPKKNFLLHYKEDNLELESDEFEIKKTYNYGKLINLPFANIIITKNKHFDAEKAEKIGNVFEINFSTLESCATSTQRQIQVDLADKDATVINLAIEGPQVDKATLILNELIAAYNKDAILDKNSESQKTKEFIDDRINKISRELSDVEDEKERFKTKNKISDILTEAKINLESSAEAKMKQLELDAQLELTNNLLSYLNKQNNTQVLPSNVGLNNADSNSSISAYNRLVLERNRILENATPQNPLVIDITKQINSMKEAVAESLSKNKMGLQISLNEYVGEQGAIDSKIIKIPYQEKLFRSLERQQQIKESLYLLLLQKREETAISLAVVAPKARTVEPVFVSDKPVAPKKMITMVVALLFAALIPFSYIYTKELFNTKIVSKNDIKKYSDLPIIAELPSINKNVDHLIRKNDFSPLAEAFRILVTNMGFMLDVASSSKIIFVTSSIKGEGKTFVSMNLALTLSNSSKVIIIGADIRNPQLQRYDQIKKQVKGLSEFLYDSSISIDDIVLKNPMNDKSDIIYSGMIPPNPTELLKNGRFEVLLEILKTRYQYIIIDTAPLLLVTDTLTIAKYADLKLYVTRSKYTEKALIEFIDETVKSGKLNKVALVLNDISSDDFGYGNKFGYGYNN
ncbi:GumC family protein [Chryseobacterium sp. FH1]|uniref:GumC family protein n=1 Tax=Chryseobacterium sp. FH1 TaxID=1233951 RepID=UPI00068FE9EB|nr:polysaccharide biosynthesis tyrosine autokinase [Chryseobacterium sp. FH1]